MGNRFSDKEIQEMIRLYRSGLSCRAVGLHFGLCKSSVQYHLKKAGCELKRKSRKKRPRKKCLLMRSPNGDYFLRAPRSKNHVFTNEEKEQILSLYKEGFGSNKIGEALGLPWYIVFRFLQRSGIPLRSRVEGQQAAARLGLCWQKSAKPLDDDKIKTMIQLYESGLTCEKVDSKMSFPLGTTSRWFRKIGYKIRPPRYPRKKK